MKRILPFLVFCSIVGMVKAQNFTATYPFSSVTATSGLTDPTPVPTATGVTFGSFRAVGQVSTNPNASARFSFQNWPLGATDGSNTFTGVIKTTQYYEVIITPQAGYTLSINSIAFTIQRSATGIRQYAVRSSQDGFAANMAASISPANANLSVVAGNTFQIADATTTASTGSLITVSGFTTMTVADTLRFYAFNAEGTGGTFSLNNVVVSGSTSGTANAAAITTSVDTLNYPSTAVGTTFTRSFMLTGSNLTNPITVSATAPYTVSDDSLSFSASISEPTSVQTTPKKIYVRLTPGAAASFASAIALTTTGGNPKSIVVAGQGIDPNNLSFNFNSCTNLGIPGGGFIAYSVVGPQVWSCTTFGTNSTNAANINGYTTTAINNEDWLISPPLKVGSLTTPVLSFNSRGEYSGPTLQLLASTNYDGFSNPDSSAFSWAALNGNFLIPPGVANSVFNFSDNINLSAYKSAAKLYLAFKYVSDTIQGAARWTVDDVNISDRSTLFSVSPTVLAYVETSVGTNSAGQAVALQSLGHKDITVAAPAEYQVSLDNSAFSSSIAIDSITAKAGTTIYVRFSPTIKAIKEIGLLHFTGFGLDTSYVSVSGSSYPKSETLDIACYNMSFFGAGSNNDLTPTARNLQKTNVETVYNHLNADIIGVEEVSSDSVFNKLVSELPGYAGILSPKWSYFFQPFDASQPGFPPQKIGFIYNTKTVKLVDSHVIDGAQYDSVRAGTKTAWTDYPTGDPTSFYSSGRLPFMATFDVTIGGITKRIKAIDIHAKALGDVTSYNRRVYDARILKDTLDTYYKNDNVIIVGDYNDRLVSSIYLNATTSPYNPFVQDKADYKALTYSLDSAGKSSFPGDVGMIDQIISSDELIPNYIPNSTDIEPANTYISPYTATTASDHLPVFSRFVMNAITPAAFSNCPNVNIAIARPGYNTYNNEGVKLYTIDTTTGAATVIPGGPLLETNTNKNMDLNGVGLNSNDGFLYGIRNAGTALTSTAKLYRIGSNYGVQPLGTIAPPSLQPGESGSAVNPAAGAFDTDGNYYFTAVSGVVTGSMASPTNYYIGRLTGLSSLSPDSVTLTPTYTKVDFSSGNCANYYSNLTSTVPITGAGANAGTGIEDITYSRAFNRLYLYASFQSPLGSGSYNGQLIAVNPTTGVASCYTASSPATFGATNNEVAGISSTANGSLLVFTTGGDLYKTTLTPAGDFTGAVTKMGASGIPPLGVTGSIRGDLASCGFGKPLTSVINPSLTQSVTAYPNPARGITTIATTTVLNNATISLIGLAGNVISQTAGVSGNTFQLNLTNTASGVYMVEINQGGNISRVEIVKQ